MYELSAVWFIWCMNYPLACYMLWNKRREPTVSCTVSWPNRFMNHLLLQLTTEGNIYFLNQQLYAPLAAETNHWENHFRLEPIAEPFGFWIIQRGNNFELLAVRITCWMDYLWNKPTVIWTICGMHSVMCEPTAVCAICSLSHLRYKPPALWTIRSIPHLLYESAHVWTAVTAIWLLTVRCITTWILTQPLYLNLPLHTPHASSAVLIFW